MVICDDFLHLHLFFRSFTGSLSRLHPLGFKEQNPKVKNPIVMEVENEPIVKETFVLGEPMDPTAMIMGGRVFPEP